MARKSKKSSSPPPDQDDDDFDDMSDNDGDSDESVDYEPEMRAGEKLRDWRDVERYKEMRELRHLVDDDLDFDDL